MKKIKIKSKTTSKKYGQEKIMPLGSRVLIRPFTKDELENKSNFGIILPESNSKEKSEKGEVLAVGPGEIDDGKRVPLVVKVGDIVVFSRYGYEEIMVDEEEFYLIKEENILAILK